MTNPRQFSVPDHGREPNLRPQRQGRRGRAAAPRHGLPQELDQALHGGVHRPRRAVGTVRGQEADQVRPDLLYEDVLQLCPVEYSLIQMFQRPCLS